MQMQALSLWRPWDGWLFARDEFGRPLKSIETRDWSRAKGLRTQAEELDERAADKPALEPVDLPPSLSDCPVCRVPECGQASKVLGLCQQHYGKVFTGHSIGLWRRNLCWSEAEDEFLKRHLSRLGYQRAAAALGRTVPGILIEAKRELGFGVLSVDGYYAMNAVERMLGVCSKKLSALWVPAGLKVYRTGTHSGKSGNPIRMVDPKELRAFLKKRPEAYDWRGLDALTASRLDLLAMPPRPRSKVVRCGTKRCRQWNTVPLMANSLQLDGRCRFCGATLPKWAWDYTDAAPMPTPRRHLRPRLEDLACYDRASDTLTCLDCGRRFKGIIAAHVKGHGYPSVRAYWQAHGLPADSPCLTRGAGRALGRHWGQTNGAYKVHGTRTPCPIYTPEEREVITKVYPRGDLPALAKQMGRPLDGIRHIAWQIGIHREIRAKRRTSSRAGASGEGT